MAFSAAGAILATGFALSARGELEPMAWAEGNLVVPAGSELTVSGGEKWNTALDVHGSVVVNMDTANTLYYVVGGSSAAPSNSSINLGTADGDDAEIRVLKGRMWGRFSNNMRSSLYFGDTSAGGRARLVIGPWDATDEQFSTLEFQAGLKPHNMDDAAIEAVVLDRSAAVWTWRLVQNNPKPVQVTFTNSVGAATGGSRPLLRGFYNGDMFRCQVAGGDIVLRGHGFYANGVTNAPIYLGTHGSGVFKTLFPAGTTYRKACVRTEGDCDFVFDPGTTGTGFHDFNATNFIWNHTGRFIVPNTGNYAIGIRTSVSGVLPYGPQTGVVRVEAGAANANKQFIDLCGTTQRVNGVELIGGARLANTAETRATLILGEKDVDGVITGGAGIDASIDIVKKGTGVLTVSSTASLANLDVRSGVLKVVGLGETTVGRLVVAPDAELRIEQTDLVCDTLVFTGRVAVANGGTITVKDKSGCRIDGVDIVQEGQPKVVPFGYVGGYSRLEEIFCKWGSGILSITQDNAPAGPIDVREGTVRIVPPACTDEYWRFVFKKTSGTAVQYGSSAPYRKEDGATPVNVYLVLGKLHLLNARGEIVNLNSSYKGTVADTALVAGGHAFTHAYFNTRNVEYGAGAEWNNGAYVALDMSSWWSATAFTNQALVADNPATWETITFRLKDGVRGVAGYMMSEGSNAAYSYADPLTWTLESSADAASVAAGQWTVRDSRTDCAMTRYGTASRDYFNSNKPFALNQVPSLDLAFTNAVSVADGAELDLSFLGADKVAISGVTVDFDLGAGKIAGFAVGANGVLDLRNPTDAQRAGSYLKSKIVLPLTLTDVGSTANLASWKVTVDGVLSPASSVVFENGNLVVKTSVGTMVIFR